MEGFIANFSATVVKKLMNEGAVPLYKTNLDELAMGGTGLVSKFGEVRNHRDKDRIVGGSSSGSVYAVAAGMVPFAIGSDTGDSIRMPAAYAGTTGFKPT
jgi:aspartyl-tRNA(Asn)/glutamyl-tRNA(Gln) amidotransferase subunit A